MYYTVSKGKTHLTGVKMEDGVRDLAELPMSETSHKENECELQLP